MRFLKYFIKCKIISNYSLQLISLLVISDLANSSPMTFKVFPGPDNCTGCIVIEADGDITVDTPNEFGLFINKNKALLKSDITVVMNSPGGNLLGGLKLGEMIRSKSLNTHVGEIVIKEDGEYTLTPGVCASSCAYAFLGGVRRSMDLKSKYGLHQISIGNDEIVSLKKAVRSTQDVIAMISHYVKKMGASHEVVTIATRTSDNSITWVTNSDCTRFSIVNSNGLVEQTSWERLSNYNWVNIKVLDDGTKDSWGIKCDRFPIAFDDKSGHVKLDLTHRTQIPFGNPYQNGDAEFKVRLLSNESQAIADDKVDFIFHGEVTFYGFQVPVSSLWNAFLNNDSLTVEISYPDNFPINISPSVHVFPLKGLENALEALKISCPHLAK